ncbi:MAG: archease [Alphaproteobacteria bacterium]
MRTESMPSATDQGGDRGARGWEHFPHGADVGVRGFGPSLEAAFEEAAVALTAALTDPAAVEAREAVAVSCEAPDDELLLVEWLNALVYEMATRGMLFGRFKVTLAGGRLAGQAWGERLDVARHQPAAEVKGATYTALKVARRDDGTWIAQCVVDV